MLLDSNIIIYSAEPQFQTIRDFIALHSPAVSAISLLEVLGYHKLNPTTRVDLEEFFIQAPMFDVDRAVLDKAVSLRQQRKMSLGDAIIAATALVHDKTLVTHNTTDFKWIANLKLIDPLAQP